MLGLSAYEGLPLIDQSLHSVHFLLCGLAVLIACIPVFTAKGSAEHKFAGMLYMPFALAALTLASILAWREASPVLFCFNAFCAYLLLSGWRAVHEKEQPAFIDWFIPSSLLVLAATMTVFAMFQTDDKATLYLLLFSGNAFYLVWRDMHSLLPRRYWLKRQVFFAGQHYGLAQSAEWLHRHIAGMVGSVMANLSVVVLTLLPLSLHWIWPVSLMVLAGAIALHERHRKARVRKTVAAILHPQFRKPATPVQSDDDLRHAA